MRAALAIFAVLLGGCAPAAGPVVAPAVEPVKVESITVEPVAYAWALPPGFPEPLVPADNPMSMAKVELGRHLFYDLRLSVTGAYSCSSCHRQELAFTDGRPQALGATGESHPRGSMSLTNVAYNLTLAWADPGLRTLEEQAYVPMFSTEPIELGLKGHEAEVLQRLRREPVYRPLFTAAFPSRSIESFSLVDVSQALASFERTLISGRSAYDRRLFLDDANALSPSATRGMELFFSERLGCSDCHQGFNLSGPVTYRDATLVAADFHNTGLYNIGLEGRYPHGNAGLFAHTHEPADMGRFRAPTLRNISVTAPYMHDGSVATLEEALEHYAEGGRILFVGPYAGAGHANPQKSPLLRGFTLDPAEKHDLLSFLHSLTDEAFLTDSRFANPWA